MLNFIDDWNAAKPYLWKTSGMYLQSVAKASGDLVAEALIDAYVQKSEEDRSWLRVSSLGKPAFEQLARRFYGSSFEPSSQLSALFLDGFMFEAYFWFIAQYMGYQKVGTQELITWNGVDGHFDGVVRCPHTGVDWLVELKTANKRLFKLIQDEGMDSVYPEYVTQLAVYTEATGLPGCWVIKNKDTSELMTVYPDDALLDSHRARARHRVAKFAQIETWEDCFRHFMPPPCKPVERRGSLIGYCVPDSMMWSEYKDLLYCTIPGKQAWITRVKEPYYQVPEGLEDIRDTWLRRYHNG